MADTHRIWRPGRLRSPAARVAGVSLLAAAVVAGTSLSPAAGAVSRPEHSAAAMAGELHGVWCTSASDCMAVGDHFSQAHGIGETLIERWNGSTWSVVPSPSPVHFPHSGAELDGVTCVSATDCLAVGWHLFSHSDLRELPFSVRWDGSKWAIVPSPSPNPQNGSLLASMACPAAGECWGVGLTAPSSLTASLTERWNGTKWAVVSTPSSSGSNCWAAGEWGSPTGTRTLIEHWNGSAWSMTA